MESLREPKIVAGLPTKAVAIAAGDRHTLVAIDSGEVYSFGGNRFGQLGHGDDYGNGPLATPQVMRVLIADREAVDDVAAGEDFRCSRRRVRGFPGEESWTGQVGTWTTAKLVWRMGGRW